MNVCFSQTQGSEADDKEEKGGEGHGGELAHAEAPKTQPIHNQHNHTRTST